MADGAATPQQTERPEGAGLDPSARRRTRRRLAAALEAWQGAPRPLGFATAEPRREPPR
jgi:hypothetical protein